MNNKELYEDYLKREQHSWLSHADNVYKQYVEIWNNTCIKGSSTEEDKLLYQYCDYEEIDGDVVLFEGEDYNSMVETMYLLRSTKNSQRLIESIAQLNGGSLIEEDLARYDIEEEKET